MFTARPAVESSVDVPIIRRFYYRPGDSGRLAVAECHDNAVRELTHRIAAVCRVAVVSAVSVKVRESAGQTGRRMGERHDAMLIQGSGDGEFQVDGLTAFDTVPLSRITAAVTR